jgi:signal transduction histidine kinase
MKNENMNANSSLKERFSNYFILFIVIANLSMGIWSSLSGYIGSYLGGLDWVASSPKMYLRAAQDIEGNLLQYVSFLEKSSFSQSISLRNGEGLLLLTRSGQWKKKFNFSQDNWKGKAEVLDFDHKCQTTGYCSIGGLIFYVVVRVLPNDSAYQKIILLRALDSFYASHISDFTNNETLIFSGSLPIGSSFRNQQDKFVSSRPSAEVLSHFAKIYEQKPYVSSGWFSVPDYRGFSYVGEEKHDRGSNGFSAFYAITTLRGTNSDVLGYVLSIVPERVLLSGVKKGALGSVFIFGFVILVGIILVKRSANSFFNPLSKVVNEILLLSREIKSDADSSGTPEKIHQPDIKNEILVLENSLKILDLAVKKSKEAVELRLERDLAKKSDRAKSLFLANISHELRTPMHGILSFARFGQQKIDSTPKEKLKSYFDEIYDSGSRLMTLLNDLLDLSKLESGKTNYSIEEQDFLEVAKIVQHEMKAFAEERGIKLDLKSETSQSIASFDRERIMQVLRNVISNGIKFSEKGSSIHVVVSQTSEKLRCSVSNRGVGIPEVELNSIFDKFVQSSKTKNGAGGTGLGLAICREIVQHHDGRIWAENTSNGETQFNIEFPRFLQKQSVKSA